MEGDKITLTPQNYFIFLKLYLSKISEFERKHFCNTLGISIDNSNTYNRVMSILSLHNIAYTCNSLFNPNGIKIIIDRNALAKFLLRSKYYKMTDSFQHSYMVGCITP